MAKKIHKGFPALVVGVVTGSALLLGCLSPAAVNAQSMMAATRAISAASAEPPVPLPSLAFGPATAFVTTPTGFIEQGMASSPALLDTASLLNAVEAAGLTPYTGRRPPVECIPSLNENSFSAFPPLASC